ncbi:protealysin inhibitor emfourin [Microbacterium oleivorans]|uniref:protealysin inhibitor emfourin n=1 Tax=Microbacterium oleivorans TaxID=273677 RepID=UPI00080E2C3D|nr:protealysin inhibitor emfourin [Microbacterium oleivorans]
MPHPVDPLTIVVVRSGGIAGLRRAWRIEVAGEEADAWLSLVDACPWGEDPASAPGADRFSWEVEAVRGEDDRRAVVGEAVGPWSELIQRVQTDGAAVRPADLSGNADA